MHQIVCRLGFCPRPIGGAYIAPPGPLAGLGMGAHGEWEGGRGGEGREGRGGRPGMPKSRVGKHSIDQYEHHTVRMIHRMQPVCIQASHPSH